MMGEKNTTQHSLAVLERYMRRLLSESERQYQQWLDRAIKGMRHD